MFVQPDPCGFYFLFLQCTVLSFIYMQFIMYYFFSFQHRILMVCQLSHIIKCLLKCTTFGIVELNSCNCKHIFSKQISKYFKTEILNGIPTRR